MNSIALGAFTAADSYFFNVNPTTAVALSVITPFTDIVAKKILNATSLNKVLTKGQVQAVTWIASAIVTAAAVTACGLPLSSASALNLMILTLCQKGFIEDVMRLREGNKFVTPELVRENISILQAIVTTVLTASAPLFKTSVIATFVFSQIATSVAKHILVDVKTLNDVLHPLSPPENNEEKKRVLRDWVDDKQVPHYIPANIEQFKTLVEEYQGDDALEEFIKGKIVDTDRGLDNLCQRAICYLKALENPQKLPPHEVRLLASVAKRRLILVAVAFPGIAVQLSALSSFTITALTATKLAAVGLGVTYGVAIFCTVRDMGLDKGLEYIQTRFFSPSTLLDNLIKNSILRKEIQSSEA